VRALRGEYGPGDPDTLAAKRLESYHDGSITRLEDTVPLGRILDVIRAPTSDGGMVVVSNDITERKHLERDLREATRVAQAASEAKALFLANMSHEIRTPMNAIIGLSHLALGTDLDDRQRDYLNKVYASAQSLLGLINDILDFSKIEAGRLELESVEFDLHEVLDNLAAVAGVKASQKGLELLFVIEPGVPMHLVGDPLRLGQVLLNLANNAVKFTEHGQVVVRVECVDGDDGSQARIRFDVTDSGIGMSTEQQARLFQSFSQVDASTTRKYGGTGLGLAISKDLVELMGGTIGVESAPGEGSTFGFTVSLERGSAPTPAPELPAHSLDRLKVLVVDDNAASREILAHYCERYGFRVQTADSGEAAIETVMRDVGCDPFRLVLMDWRMPGIDGLEAAHRIRERTGGGDEPAIVIVTAYGREDVARQAKDLSGFLVKPVTPSTLLDSVMVAFGERKGATQRGRGTAPELAAHVRGARLLLAEDNAINQQVAVELLEQAGAHVTVAENGLEALEALEHDAFDGVLMDMQMPVMDGLGATVRIREDPRFAALPVIAMTANAMEDDRQRCLDAGMNDHVAKPIVVRELFETLGRWVRAATPAPAATDSGASAAAGDEEVSLPPLEGIDVADGLARMGGNSDGYRRILRQFAGSQARAPDQVRAALESGDRSLAERVAHTLKGVAGNIGAGEVRVAAAKLEGAIRAGDEDATALIEPTAAALAVVLGSIDSLPERAPASAVRALDHEAVRVLLDRLRAQIEEFDADAVDTGHAVASGVAGSPLAAPAADLLEAIDRYDFDAAGSLVDTLAAALDRAASGPGTDPEVRALVERLGPLLADSDAEALEVVTPLVDRLAGSRHESTARDVAECVERFDFEAATGALDRLVSTLEPRSA